MKSVPFTVLIEALQEISCKKFRKIIITVKIVYFIFNEMRKDEPRQRKQMHVRKKDVKIGLPRNGWALLLRDRESNKFDPRIS